MAIGWKGRREGGGGLGWRGERGKGGTANHLRGFHLFAPEIVQRHVIESRAIESRGITRGAAPLSCMVSLNQTQNLELQPLDLQPKTQTLRMAEGARGGTANHLRGRRAARTSPPRDDVGATALAPLLYIGHISRGIHQGGREGRHREPSAWLSFPRTIDRRATSSA